MPGSVIAGNAAAKAGKAAAKASEKAAKLEYMAGQQAREDLGPWRDQGGAAMSQVGALLGLGYAPTRERMSNLLLSGDYSPTDDRLAMGPAYTGYGGSAYYDYQGNPILPGQSVKRLGEAKEDPFGITLTNPGYYGSTGVGGAGGTNPNDPRARDQADAMKYFYTSPDYQFRLSEGQKAIDRSAASRGMLLSGAQLKASDRFGQETASGEYGNYVNRLLAAAGMGQTATGTGAGITARAGAGAAGNVAQAGAQRASGYAQQGAMYGKGLSNLFNSAASVAGYYAGMPGGSSATPGFYGVGNAPY